MITEFAIAGTIVYTFRYLQDAPNRKIIRKFDDIVYEAGLTNRTGEGYKLKNIEKKEYGYTGLVSIPDGKDIDALLGIKKAIETKLKAIIDIEKDDFKDFGRIKIVINPLNSKDYKPIHVKPDQLFLGYNLDGTPFIIDLNKDPHILLAGKTGTGKTFEFTCTLANSIYFNKKNIDVYLFQIMKGEIDILKDCPSVKFTSDNPSEILIVLKKLIEMIHTRSKKFTDKGIKNIKQWNKHFPKERMKRILIGVEEISFFMRKDESDNNPFFKYFTEIVKAGRTVGMHFIGVTQRTTVANLGGDGELKSQLSVITAQQRTELDSRNAIDIPDASRLKQQEFIASVNDGYVRFKAPYIDEDYLILNKYIPEIKVPKIDLEKKETKVVVKDRLTYEETQKLKTYGECYILKNEEPKEGVKEVPKEETKTKKKEKSKRPGAVKKEKEGAITNERT